MRVESRTTAAAKMELFVTIVKTEVVKHCYKSSILDIAAVIDLIKAVW